MSTLARGLVVGFAWLVLALPARAALFADDEARNAILELRQKVQQLEQVQVLQRSVLELNGQLESLRGEIAKLRGADEQLTRDLADVQRRQKDITQGVDDRIRKLEPVKVTVDGREFMADPEEKRLFDDSLASLRNGDYDKAAVLFGAFLRRYPASGYVDSARFWLGNAQYGKREYKDAIASFRALVASSPDSPRAPEALLAVANCQIESKDVKGARATIAELLKTYPKSEAAQAGRERLAARQ